MTKQYEETPNNNDMYQASDGKWYPKQAMPNSWQQNQQGSYYGQQHQPYGQQPYGQQPMGAYGQSQYQPQPQPVYVQQGGGAGGGMAKAGGMGCLAATCGALLCFNLGACLF